MGKSDRELMPPPNGTASVDKDEEDEPYVPFVTAAQRKRQRLNGLKMRSSAPEEAQSSAATTSTNSTNGTATNNTSASAAADDNDNTEPTDSTPMPETTTIEIPTDVYADRSVSLLQVSQDIAKKVEDDPEYAKMRRSEDERRMLEQATATVGTSFFSSNERASGTKFQESLCTGWNAPRHVRKLNNAAQEKMRAKWHILVEGEDVPPPLKSFKDMRFPRPILDALKAKNIQRPTPIQVQGLPVALSGRDMIGIAFTGSGKTMTFTLPMVMVALGEELKLPLVGGEGPFGLIMGPSRELQRQTCEVVQYFCDALAKDPKYPPLRVMLAIGGENKREQLDQYTREGVHMIVATPGRLNDFLKTDQVNMHACKYLVLDEGDRMMDMGFDEEVQRTLGYCSGQRQTLLFSATMPKKFVDFAMTALVRPVTVNVGRAGAANLDVIQEVEYVKQEAKIVYLLQCLQKTAPPVVIFSERKNDVDDIHEYLLLKGVEAVAVHGGKDQADRNYAIDNFKMGKKDVLVATDIAAKGLDFPAIQHVINFDMPAEIENYVHRIGRTGRGGKTGVATTFINKAVEEHTLLDLKHLLKEAKQRIPPVLMAIPDPEEEDAEDETLGKGCSYCGGLGHRITSCPKVEGTNRKQAGQRDVVGGATYSGDW